MASIGDSTPSTTVDVDQFTQSIKGIDRTSFAYDGDRVKALREAYALISRLETSWDTVARLCITEPALTAALKVSQDLQLFEKWLHVGEQAEQSTAQLAELTNSDPVLLGRILRHLASTNIIIEVSADHYKQSAFSRSLLEPVFGAWIPFLHDTVNPCFAKMPEYLAKTDYQNPTDPNDGIFQYTKNSPGSLFDYYAQHPAQSAVFNNVMGSVMAKQAGMLDIFPYDRLADDRPDDDSVIPLLVDVGGNVGHDMNKFLGKNPGLAGRLVLQDRPEVVRQAICPAEVRAMAHDFFTPQPVKGARAYYLHGVLHDWSDALARQILEHLRDAMTPGYSTLLIHDHVIPAVGAHPQATGYDHTMMVLVSAFERTEGMWQDLLASVGLRVVKIWSSPLATQSVIEAKLSGDS
ncbi:S-adenosyl-L-methionine-dependent methyltransferase [Aspergillus brunneoviolaceus CBS 621.78]|uniref:S-adenosyl-L-methionine-dependent methyltransferase n=1 Tax=Aspergillus brunneoviolaceus CBS 621.78 TaxID=1450534 RepID=A0ACD1GFC2_9EURO|nr:S-adenosyl-L-methionine-dependent methyltransferase [Aspergillus brunneoviolaceus CBS 621.78]RAH47963.1 S-adenosyl-L-methionine-dependent methyltransferase [Aspergillus brunneoviolaceus CBS 621.78]